MIVLSFLQLNYKYANLYSKTYLILVFKSSAAIYLILAAILILI
jgi:hypothetical protein